MLFDLSQFDQYREDNRREVKKARGGLPASLWDTYSSFANSYGGVIILGIGEREDGSWYTTGLENERRLLKEFWDNIHNRQLVSVNLLTDRDVQTYTESETGHVILVITVPMAQRDQRPVYIKNDIWNGPFRRNWEGDYHCTTAEIKAMLRDQPDASIDMRVIESLTVDQLNKDTMQRYRNRHRLMRPAHTWSTLTDADYLEMIGAAAIGTDRELHPTAAGLLMFGDEFRIIREFPEYFLDYREMLDPTIRWTDRFYSSTGEWSGNLFDFYFGVYNRISKDLRVPFKLIGGDRVDDTPVHKALREVLANCLVNSDFFVPRGIVIKKDSDRLVFENPGYIRVGKAQMRKGGESDPRNKALMKMFNMIDIGERAGSGVPELFAVWEQEGWEEPVIEERFGDASRTIVTVSFRKKTVSQYASKKATDKKQPIKATDKKQPAKASGKTLHYQAAVLQYLSENKTVTTKEVASLLGLSSDRCRVLLRNMTQLGMLQASGGNRNRTYSLN